MGHYYPREIINHGVWLYHHFTLGYRDISIIFTSRGIQVSYEAIRLWCLKFPSQYPNIPRIERGRFDGNWHLDEVLISMKGKCNSLWLAVDQDGNVIDLFVQSHSDRDKRAAANFFRKLFKGKGYTPLKNNHRQP